MDRDVGPGPREAQLLFDEGGFPLAALPHQALVVAVQAPDKDS